MKIKKIKMYGSLLVLGVILVVIGGFVVKNPELKALSGVLIGVGAGLFGMSGGELIKNKLIQKDPLYNKKLEIEQKDERNIYIRNTAKGKAFDIMSIVYSILMLIFILLEAELIFILLIVSAYVVGYGIYFRYLYKYSNEM